MDTVKRKRGRPTGWKKNPDAPPKQKKKIGRPSKWPEALQPTIGTGMCVPKVLPALMKDPEFFKLNLFNHNINGTSFTL